MKPIIIIALIGLFTLSAGAEDKIFVITPGQFQNVTFHSQATIESFKGTTDRISGNITVDAEDLMKAAAVCSVDMASLDTGINLRNQHMKNNHLHTNTYPRSVFRLRKIEGADALKEDNVVYFNAIGTFTLHGVEHRLEVKASVTYYPNGTHTPLGITQEALHIQGEFSVLLKDYMIPLPKFLFMKLAEKQEVTVDFWAVKGEANEEK